jgi:importin subunit alpha-1
LVIDSGVVPILIKILQNSTDQNVIEQIVWCLGNISGDSAPHRDYLLKLGVMDLILGILSRNDLPITALRNALWTLSNLCEKPTPDWSFISPALPILAKFIYHNDDEVKKETCWAIAYLCSNVFQIQQVINTNIVPRLCELVNDVKSFVQAPALQAVADICNGNKDQVQVVLDCNIFQSVLRMLKDADRAPKQRELQVISNIISTDEDQIDVIITMKILASTIRLMQESERPRTKRAASLVVANVACRGRDWQLNFIAAKRVIKPLCRLLKNVKHKEHHNWTCTVLKGLCRLFIYGCRHFSAINQYTQMIVDDVPIKKVKLLETYEGDAGIAEYACKLKELVESQKRITNAPVMFLTMLHTRLVLSTDPFKDCSIVLFS